VIKLADPYVSGVIWAEGMPYRPLRVIWLEAWADILRGRGGIERDIDGKYGCGT
jgi:hypothetical protein